MWTIAIKELRILLYSPKFIVLFIASCALVALALINGYVQLNTERATALQLRQQQEAAMAAAESPMNLYNFGAVMREPRRLSLFTFGATGMIGRTVNPGSFSSARVTDSRYEQDPILAIFGELDLAFIVGTALSLFALLLSYNSISGEREAGTLQLMVSNPIRRSTIIAGKLIGGYIPLALMFLLPVLFGLVILITLTDVNFNLDEWANIALMIGLAHLYLAVFHVTGIAVSSFTRQSFVSFLACLLIWVASCFVLPPFAIQGAQISDPPMSQEEMLRRASTVLDESRTIHNTMLRDYLEQNRMTMDEYHRQRSDIWERTREAANEEIARRMSLVTDEYERQRALMRDAAARYALASPTASLQMAFMKLCESDPELLDRYRTLVSEYGKIYTKWREKFVNSWMERNRGKSFGMGFRINRDNEGYLQFSGLDTPSGGKLDLTSMPRFTYHAIGREETEGVLLTIFAQLALAAIIPFAIAWVAFLRYDVR